MIDFEIVEILVRFSLYAFGAGMIVALLYSVIDWATTVDV